MKPIINSKFLMATLSEEMKLAALENFEFQTWQQKDDWMNFSALEAY